MILNKPTPWGFIKGKLSLTPEQAKRMFNFDMHPDAIGVVLYKMKGKYIIKNLMPPPPPRIGPIERTFGKIGKFGTQIIDLIYDAWNPLAKRLTYSGFALFTKINMQRIKKLKREKDWKKLLLTMGTIPPPRITYIRYLNKKVVVYMKNPELLETGIILLHSNRLYHIKPKIYPIAKPVYIAKFPKTLPIIFIYFKKAKTNTHPVLYSNSSSIILWKKAKEILIWQYT